MKSSIIVEGPDGAGKSTLGRKLAEHFNVEYIHTGGAANTVAELNARCWQIAEDMANGHKVFDRCCHISDTVYKNALGVPLLKSRAELLSDLRALDPVVIYCRRRSLKDMFDSISSEKKEHKSPEYLEKVKLQHYDIVRGYDDIIQEVGDRGIRHYRFDWEFDSYEEMLRDITKCVA